MKNIYKEDSIISLSPLEFTRLRPGVYCGSTEYSTQLLTEIIANAVDEHKAGHGDKIKIDIKEDNSITVLDNGQGFIPNSIREDGKTILEASFSVLNTSGKYNDNGVYEGISLGLNGLGSKITTYLSHWLKVITWRDGQFEEILFKEGVFSKRNSGKCEKDRHGTEVSWLPSEEFFTHPEVEIKEIEKLLKTLACLCPGLEFNLNDKKFYSKNGLNDLVDEETKNKEIIKKRLNINFVNNKNKLDLILTYTNNYSSVILPYVNTGLTDSGPHITQIKTILTREFNKFFKEKKWLKEKDENLTGDDCQEGMFLVFNLTTTGIGYDAQIKSRITKLDMKPFTDVIASSIQNWLSQNEKEVKVIADKAINARKAREAARKARENARQPKDKKKQFLNLPSKLVDCWGKNRNKCELFIVEGKR